MTLRSTPELKIDRPPKVHAFEVDPALLSQWDSELRAEGHEASNVIGIYDRIGVDPWTGEGVTAKRVAAALRSIKDDAITLDLHSPGGDYFEGVAIYNLLVKDGRPITVRVVGTAASAASIIAMAGDKVLIDSSASIMIHNCWGMTIGDWRDDLESMEKKQEFDAAMAEVYSVKSGRQASEFREWMNAETYFRGRRAIEVGLADAELHDKVYRAEVSHEQPNPRQAFEARAKDMGLSRSQMRALWSLREDGTPSAAAHVTPRADDDWTAAMRSLTETLKR